MKRTGFARRSLPERMAPVYARLTVPVHRVRISDELVAFPKEPEGRNRHLLDMARDRRCLLLSPICNHDNSTVVACHGAGIENGKGMGRKVSDAMTVHGCSACNDYTDAFYRATKAEKKAVFDAGLVRQIELWIVIAADPKAGHKDRKAASWALRNIFTRQA